MSKKIKSWKIDDVIESIKDDCVSLTTSIKYYYDNREYDNVIKLIRMFTSDISDYTIEYIIKDLCTGNKSVDLLEELCMSFKDLIIKYGIKECVLKNNTEYLEYIINFSEVNNDNFPEIMKLYISKYTSRYEEIINMLNRYNISLECK